MVLAQEKSALLVTHTLATTQHLATNRASATNQPLDVNHGQRRDLSCVSWPHTVYSFLIGPDCRRGLITAFYTSGGKS